MVETLREIARAEEASRRMTGRYVSLVPSGPAALRRIEVHAKEGIAGPIWIARVGRWTANQDGLLFEIACDPEGSEQFW